MRPLRNFYKLTALAIALIATQLTLSAQTLKDLFTNSETPLMYYGVDFTKAKVIDDDKANALDIRDRQFTAINELIINESEKFDIKSAFNRTVDHDISSVGKRNEKVNVEEIKSTSSADYHRLKDTDIPAIVKGIDAGNIKKGVGLVFIVEGMSKSEKHIAVWVTLFDPKTKKVLLTERMEGKAAGFGFRNYWAGGIKDVINDIKKSKYSAWKSKYGS
jgi:hypothetical protein